MISAAVPARSTGCANTSQSGQLGPGLPEQQSPGSPGQLHSDRGRLPAQSATGNVLPHEAAVVIAEGLPCESLLGRLIRALVS